MKSSRSGKFFVIYTLYLVIAIAVYVLFYIYIDSKDENALAITTEIEQLKEQNNQMDNLLALVAETKEAREQLPNYFIDSEQIIEFLETIESLADIASVEIDVKNINESDTESEGVRTLELNIDFSGSWVQVHHFLVLIESMPIKLTTERVTINENVTEEGAMWTGSVFFKALQVEK